MTFFAPPSSVTPDLVEFENEYAISVARKHIEFHKSEIAKLEPRIEEIKRVTADNSEPGAAELLDVAAAAYKEILYHRDRIALMERCIATLSIRRSDIIKAAGLEEE